MPTVAGQALRAEAEIEMTEAKRRTPVKTGTLKGSGHVIGPIFRFGLIRAVLAFGGPARGYAIYVHENLEAWHKNGQAKFLESTLRQSAKSLAERVARRMHVLLKES